MDRLQPHAEEAASHFALGQNLLRDKLHFIRRQGKTNSVVVAGQGRDLRVHADRFAVHVDQWSAAVAAVDRGVGLQETLKAGVGSVAVFLRDDAGSYGLIQSER